jgi:predicted Zn-ribbon and HTH transcriptional regulator
MTVIIHRCHRCTHEWASRKQGIPKYCPRCKSPYWHKERAMKKATA